MTSLSTSSDVARAALSVELERRGGAMERYQAARARYELRRLVLLRKRIAVESHRQTLAVLKETVDSVGAICCPNDRGDGETIGVPDALVAAVRVFLSSPQRDKHFTRQQLQAALSSFFRTAVVFSTSSVGSLYSQKENEEEAMPSLSTPSPLADNRMAPETCVLSDVHLRPLLHWAALGLDYRGCRLNEKCRVASELARAKYELLLLQRCYLDKDEEDQLDSGNIDVLPSSATRQQAEVEAARSELKRAKDLQRSVKRRLYECHRWIAQAMRQSADTGAAEMHAQIVKELRCGRVTLLRLACETETAAFPIM